MRISLVNAASCLFCVSLTICGVWSDASTSSKQTISPVVDGPQLFLNACSSCHGANGQGGEGPSLQSIGLTSQQIVMTVTKGVPGEMPSFAKRFKPSTMKIVANYVLTLKKR
jgi:mono/diheme cytochrome c family protein